MSSPGGGHPPAPVADGGHGGSGKAAVMELGFKLRRSFQLQPVAPEEAAEAGHGLSAIELHGVVASDAREDGEIYRRCVVRITAAIAQQVHALMPEIEMQWIGMGGPEAVGRQAKQSPATGGWTQHGVATIREEGDRRS